MALSFFMKLKEIEKLEIEKLEIEKTEIEKLEIENRAFFGDRKKDL